MNLKTQKELQFFHNKDEYLRRFEDAVQRLSRSRHIKMKKPTKIRSPKDCRQAIFTSGGIYCGLLRERVDEKFADIAHFSIRNHQSTSCS